jgi:hypothetical protein
MDKVERDKLERYRDIVRRVLTSVANIAYSNPAIVHEAVFDTVNDRYLVMSVGWKAPTYRLHFCLLHLDIIEGKIWIQRDGTENGVAYDLEEAGVPKSDIVLAFHSESVRPHTGYAIA